MPKKKTKAKAKADRASANKNPAGEASRGGTGAVGAKKGGSRRKGTSPASAAGATSSRETAHGQKPAKKKVRKKPAPRNSKAQAVRDYLASHPEAGNREVIMALAERGIVIEDYLPSAIRSEGTPAGLRRKAGKAKRRPQVDGTPVIRLRAPLYEDFARDLLKARVHTSVVKSIRVLCAQLSRIVEIVELLKDDDWEIEVAPKGEGLFFTARHRLVEDEAQAVSRTAKLGIKPKEIEIAMEPKKLALDPDV